MKSKKPALFTSLLFLAAIFGVPMLIKRTFNHRVLREGDSAVPEVALTFDDGPDPETTPKVLEILRERNVKATFFMLGSQIEKHPELARQVLEEGHEVALHGYRHVNHLLRLPWQVKADLQKAVAVYERVLGQKPEHFRPPHGVYTWGTIWAEKALNLKPVHWTIAAGEWLQQVSSEDVRERILDELDFGAVVLLHDARWGSEKVIEMLPNLLQDLKTYGYSCKPLAQLQGLRTGTIKSTWERLLAWYDRVYDRSHGIDPLTRPAHGLYRIGLAAFPGESIMLGSGEIVEHNSMQGELHLHNRRMVKVARHNKFSALKMVRRSMQDLAKEIENNPKYRNIQIFFGLSLMDKIGEELGFQYADLPQSKGNPFLYFGFNLIRFVYTGQWKNNTARLIYIDRDTLLERYGKKTKKREQQKV
ncbi:polysaccharide deacetylase family protein [Deinococcus roseus]|uniref:Polysaccharide deacetylase familiy protein n=1 Tax=Deinococcus roseus TaxID=392414 RepID=A0ABQ2CTL2_9DEIO|nr:polysaccharide deacetylase family protein [Deinococcus roseus]GGJ19337.1 polysaccharide deacetylase familiy protein [Deinococcus roseus]